MSLTLAFAECEDATRIAEIHMAVFGSNAMLLAQFPTPTTRDGLRKSIELKALADIDDSRTTVLVIRFSIPESPSNAAEVGKNEPSCERLPRGKVIAFAKWAHPVSIEEDYTEPSWIWPAGTDLKIVKDWSEVAEQAQSRAVGNTSCYREYLTRLWPIASRKAKVYHTCRSHFHWY